MESESPELREQNTSSTPSPIASESQVQQISNPKKPLLKFVNKTTKNKKKNSGVVKNGCPHYATMCFREATLECRIIFYLYSGMGLRVVHVGLIKGWR